MVEIALEDGDDPVESLTVTAESLTPEIIDSGSLVIRGAASVRVLEFRTRSQASGYAQVRLKASDPIGNDASAVLYVSVQAANDPPTLNGLQDIEVGPDDFWIPVQLSGIHSGGLDEFQTLFVTARSSNPSLISVVGQVYHSPGTSGTLYLSPIGYSSGVSDVTVSVVDDASGTYGGTNRTSRTFRVTRKIASPPPSLVASLTTATGHVAIRWLLNGTEGFVLQAAASLEDSTQWKAVESVPEIIGDQNQVVVPANETKRFYRLAK